MFEFFVSGFVLSVLLVMFVMFVGPVCVICDKIGIQVVVCVFMGCDYVVISCDYVTALVEQCQQ